MRAAIFIRVFVLQEFLATGREHLVDKLENLPRALKGPVETVLKVGWGKVNLVETLYFSNIK